MTRSTTSTSSRWCLASWRCSWARTSSSTRSGSSSPNAPGSSACCARLALRASRSARMILLEAAVSASCRRRSASCLGWLLALGGAALMEHFSGDLLGAIILPAQWRPVGLRARARRHARLRAPARDSRVEHLADGGSPRGGDLGQEVAHGAQHRGWSDDARRHRGRIHRPLRPTCPSPPIGWERAR